MFGNSQMFTIGASQTAETLVMGAGSAEARKPRQEEKQSCLPVTVQAIRVATSGKSDDEIQIHGMEPSILILVGAVESLSQQAACTEFVLNDGTGRIRAKYFSNGSENVCSGIESGRYVSLAAQLRTAPEPHISVTAMRAVRTADEISYHMIECAHAMLKLRQGDVEPATPEKKRVSVSDVDMKISPPKMAVNTPGSIPALAVDVSVPVVKVLTGEALREAILSFLRQEGETKPEGTHVEQLRVQFASSSEQAEIAALVEKLVQNGDIFNTIDECHFSAL
jgi:replication factor A2